MNIPDSPDELLREYHKANDGETVCHCKACKATRTIISLELNVAELMIMQCNLLQNMLDEMFKMTQFMVSIRDIPSAIALSHLAGQVAATLAAVKSCITTIRVMNEASSD